MREAIYSVDPYPEALLDRYPFVRLDFNENNEGLEELQTGKFELSHLSAYPQYGKLIEALAGLYDVHGDQIMLSTGSDEALPSIAYTLLRPGIDSAVIARPTFSVIRHALVLADAKLVEVPVLSDMTFDEHAIEQALAEHLPNLVILATPDNPTGAMLSAGMVERWIAAYPDTYFLIDEAYYEYTGVTVLPLLKSNPNLLVLRTFSKAWGLAGLRVGVTLGSVELIRVLKRARLPFSVSSVAAEIVYRACDYRQQVESMARETMQRKARIIQALRERQHLLIEGHANFYLLNAAQAAGEVFHHLKLRNILVRNLSRGQPGPDNALWGYLRIAVGTCSDNEKLLEALDSFVPQP